MQYKKYFNVWKYIIKKVLIATKATGDMYNLEQVH